MVDSCDTMRFRLIVDVLTREFPFRDSAEAPVWAREASLGPGDDGDALPLSNGLAVAGDGALPFLGLLLLPVPGRFFFAVTGERLDVSA